MLWLINQEDMTKEPAQQNLPGTTSEYPNWSRKMRWSLADLSAAFGEPARDCAEYGPALDRQNGQDALTHLCREQAQPSFTLNHVLLDVTNRNNEDLACRLNEDGILPQRLNMSNMRIDFGRLDVSQGNQSRHWLRCAMLVLAGILTSASGGAKCGSVRGTVTDPSAAVVPKRKSRWPRVTA